MTEEFTEYRPADEGRNLMHHRGHRHVMGPNCPCGPTDVQHADHTREDC